MGGGLRICARFSIALFFVQPLLGCVFTPHELALAPKTQVTDSDVGGGTDLYFRFVDERDDTTVGHRGVATVGAKISADALPTLMESQIREGLARKQYHLVDTESPNHPSVVFRLVSFKYYVEQGFWTGGEEVNAALAVDARRADKSFNNVYRYSNDHRLVVVPGGSELDTQMNTALNDILSKEANDRSLDSFLTGK